MRFDNQLFKYRQRRTAKVNELLKLLESQVNEDRAMPAKKLNNDREVMFLSKGVSINK